MRVGAPEGGLSHRVPDTGLIDEPDDRGSEGRGVARFGSQTTSFNLGMQARSSRGGGDKRTPGGQDVREL
jgi:hypothetical protein